MMYCYNCSPAMNSSRIHTSA